MMEIAFAALLALNAALWALLIGNACWELETATRDLTR